MNALARNYRSWIALIVILFFSQGKIIAQISAKFTASPVSGCSPVVVFFTDQSTGNPTQWRWDLGNGVTSFLQNPSTTYFNAGTYNVKLVVRNAAGADSIIKNQFITVNPNPVVNFKASDSTGCFPLPVQFTDLSTSATGTVTTWNWDFGDGTTSSVANPFHTYTAGGNFNVTLRVVNSFGCIKTFSKTQYIQTSNGVKSDFTNSSPSQCSAPVTITFTNTTTGSGALTYTWDFGDGSKSNAKDPVHTYLNAGSYTVMLVTVSPQGCRDTMRKANLISIGTITSNFTMPDSVCAGTSFSLSNTTTPVPGSVLWNFGDGTTSTQSNPIKTYSSTGTFTIKLVNNFGACSDSISKNIFVNPKPVADFSSNQTISCNADFTANFINQTNGNNTYVWNFGDGGTSTDANPSHTYSGNGDYTVTLVATNSNGCSDTVIKSQFIHIQTPVITVNGFPQTGCTPITIHPTATVVSNQPVATYLWDFGDGTTSNAMNPSHTYSTAGNYNVTLIITTAGGCTDTVIVTDAVKVGNKPHANFSVNPKDVCAFVPVQFTDLSTGVVDHWYWQFGDGGTSTVKNPLYAYSDTGWFSVTLIVWSNTCPDTIRFKDIVHIRPPIASFVVKSTCTDKYKKEFIDRSIGATGWQWTFGDGATSTLPNPVHTYSAVGSYNVMLVVTNGTCTHMYQQAVTIIDERSDFAPDNTTICKGSAITFTSLNINAVNISYWLWDFGDGTTSSQASGVSHTYPKAGVYAVSLTITDVVGCTDKKTIIITVYGPTADFSPNVPGACLGQSTIVFADLSKTDGLNAIIKWTWNYGDGVTDSTTPPPYSHFYLNAGVYDVSLTVRDNYGCIDKITKPSAVVIAQPKADFNTPDTNSCIGKPVSFINASVGYTLQYLWGFGDGGSATAANPTHSYSAIGSYPVKLLVTDKYGCKDSITKPNYITISIPKASFTVSDSISTCPPLLVNFTNTSSNYVSLAWDFDDGNTSTLDNPSHYYTIPGVYFAKLTATGPGGCTDVMRQRIEVRGPKGSFTYAPLLGCNPLTVTFTAKTLDRVSFIWDFSDGTTIPTTDSVISHTYTSPGDYIPKMILLDAGGCVVPITGIDTIRVKDVEAKFSLDNFNLCDSGYVTFRDETVSNDLITSYQWSFGDGTFSSSQFPSHHYAVPGGYDIRFIVTTQTGCIDTVQLNDTVKVFVSPIISIKGDSASCAPANFNYYGQVDRGDATLLNWRWDLANGQNSTLQNPPVQNYNNAGAYIITSAVTDNNGCKDSVAKTVNVYPIPVVDAGPDALVCRGDSIQLNATGAATYVWNASPDLSCLNCGNPYATPRDTTTYTVTGTTQFGCVNSDSVRLRVRQPFTLLVGPGDSICVGKSVLFSASGADKYSWSPSSSLDKPTSPNPKATPTVSTLYTVIAYDNDNCFADTATVYVKVTQLPTVEAGPDITLPVGSSVKLNPVGSKDIISWKWTPGNNLSCLTCPDPTASPRQTTKYFIEVKNDGGCVSVDNMTVFVVCNNGNLFIPNSFSPNGDGVNDRFFPRGTGLATIRSLRVFDRWGEVVFEKLNFSPNDPNSGWDGTYKGQKLSPDVYVYNCEIVCENNQLLMFKGDITLLR